MTIFAAIGASTTTAEAATGAAPIAGPRVILPFGQENIAAGDNATPASSTPVQLNWCGVSTLGAANFVANRAGSIVGIGGVLTAAASGSVAIIGVYKNGTIVNASAAISYSIAGGTENYTTFAAGTYTFVPGDNLDIRIRTGSGWDVLTTDIAAYLELELTS
jgi:hypothetical protein